LPFQKWRLVHDTVLPPLFSEVRVSSKLHPFNLSEMFRSKSPKKADPSCKEGIELEGQREMTEFSDLSSGQIDFIQDLKKTILKDIPTNPDWAESIAVTTLNAVVADRIFAVDKIGPLHPNLFFLAIGPSGLAAKTIPIKYYQFPILMKFKELTGKDVVLPNRFSIEGLISHLKSNSSGVIVRDEFSSLFKEKNKSYLGDVLEFLSELCDGSIQKRATRTVGMEESQSICVNFIGATTPYIFSIMDIGFFVQGTGNRFLYILNEANLEPTPEDFFFADLSKFERDGQITRFAERLKNFDTTLGSQKFTGLLVDDREMIAFRDEMMKKSSEAINSNDDVSQRYYVRLSEMAIKLATTKAICNFENKAMDKENRCFPIMAKDSLWAITKVRKHLEYFERLKTSWKITTVQKPVLVVGNRLEYVKLLIPEKGNIQRSDLLRKSGMNSEELQECLSLLLQRGEVDYDRSTLDSTNVRGVKPIFYRRTGK
jgi:hypothetical protein